MGGVCPTTTKNNPTPVPVYIGKPGGPKIELRNEFAVMTGSRPERLGLKVGTKFKSYIVTYANGYKETYYRGISSDGKPVTQVQSTAATYDNDCYTAFQSFNIKS